MTVQQLLDDIMGSQHVSRYCHIVEGNFRRVRESAEGIPEQVTISWMVDKGLLTRMELSVPQYERGKIDRQTKRSNLHSLVCT